MVFETIDIYQQAIEENKKPIFVQNTNSKPQIIENSKFTLILKNHENKGILENLEEGETKMPNIRKRKNGLWEARIKKNYKSYSVYARTKTDLNKKLKDLKKEIENKQQTKEKTFIDYYNYWFDLYKKPFLKQNTLEHMQGIFNKHILPIYQNMKLIDVTHENIQKFLNTYERSRTKEFITTYMQAMMKKAYQEELINKNPFELIIKEKRIKANKTAFTYEEQIKILNAVKETEIFNIIEFYLVTGVRRSEALNLTKECLINNNKIHIKGTKTEDSNRIIKVTSNYFRKLKILFEKEKPFNFTKDFITSKFKSFLKKLNIEGNLHCLRHTYASNMHYLGANLKFVQKQMGHSSYQITADIYTNLEDEKIEANKINSLYNNYYYVE